MLKETYFSLLAKYTSSQKLRQDFWLEIEQNYSRPKRHYHTLLHLEHLIQQLESVKEKIQNWEAVLWSLYYHDIVYNSLSTKNEEKSADLAEKRMKELSVPSLIIHFCRTHILATKAHTPASLPDTDYFTDADLSILGQDWDTYFTYCKNVRKEFSVYPDFMYNPGRQKVLKYFLGMERIYKTDYFHHKLETLARKNLVQELYLLE